MNYFHKIIDLAKNEGGKFFILGDSGEPELVVMSMADYEALKSDTKITALAERLSDLSAQTEELNRRINDVQLEEFMDEELQEETAAEEQVNDSYYIEPIRDEQG